MESNENPMGYKPIPKLLFSLAIPAMIANLVNSLYSVVDQIFIGQGIGFLGNAATNIAFPLTTISLAIGLLVGLGSAATFSLELGKGNPEKSRHAVGTAATILLISGIVVAAIVLIFLEPIMIAFGATPEILDYAMAYAGITAFGLPFLFISTGTNPLVRADGHSTYSMVAIITGAILNMILDYVFIFPLNMGIEGAAIATVISQIVPALILLAYFPRFEFIKLKIKDFIPDLKILLRILALGLSVFIFQISNVIVQIVSNNMFNIFGAASIYGSNIPIAVSGIVLKLNVIFTTVIIGLVQGGQPIMGYCYGAEKYKRVKDTYKLILKLSVVISIAFWIVFQAFPAQLIQIFGNESQLYMDFAVKYMHIFLFFVFINGAQITASTFFQAIGMAKKGALLSLTKQIIYLLPLLVILPQFFGLFGIVYATPLADLLSFITAMVLVIREFRKMPDEDVIK